eukprot:358519-Chlamydomonas_euryale.AAC.10
MHAPHPNHCLQPEGPPGPQLQEQRTWPAMFGAMTLPVDVTACRAAATAAACACKRLRLWVPAMWRRPSLRPRRATGSSTRCCASAAPGFATAR